MLWILIPYKKGCNLPPVLPGPPTLSLSPSLTVSSAVGHSTPLAEMRCRTLNGGISPGERENESARETAQPSSLPPGPVPEPASLPRSIPIPAHGVYRPVCLCTALHCTILCCTIVYRTILLQSLRLVEYRRGGRSKEREREG